MKLSVRAKASWGAHFFKAVARQHHREMIPAFAAVLAPNSVVIEAGGHAGQYTKLIAGLIPQGHLYSFEPGSYAYSILRRVVRLRRLRNVTAQKAALGASEGSIDLHVPIKANGVVRFGLSHAGASGSKAAMVSEAVPQFTVDGILAKQGLARVDLLKADIEGWELQMLLGARQTIETHRPTLFLEVNDEHLKRAGDSAAALWDFIQGYGYRAFTFDEKSGKFIASAQQGLGDFWFVRAELAEKILG